MLFFFKKKKIVLDCFTHYHHAYEFFKIEPAKKFLPTWWKNLPVTYREERSIADLPTMKTCFGFTNNFKHGYIMPLWSDTHATMAQTGPRQFGIAGQNADAITRIESHPTKQFEDFIDTDIYMHVKIGSPWLFRCSEDINWSWTQPTWNTRNFDDYLVLPGMTDFKYQTSTHVNIITRRLNRNNQSNILHIPAGQPLVHIVPLTDREVEVKNHLVSQEEWANIDAKNVHISWFNNYTKVRSLRKSAEESKCPFNFGRK
jgi:hypothetical protein